MNSFPQAVLALIDGEAVEEIVQYHVSGDKVFQIGKKYILKISDNIIGLQNEKERNDYLVKFLPVPKSILFLVEDEKAYYLKEYLQGKPLCHDDYLNRPNFIVDMLVAANNMIHSVDVSDCPFESSYSAGNKLIHGDLCLPNILIENDEISGIIDLDSAGVGDVYYDYVWSLWSLEFNLKTDKYNQILMEKLNMSTKELDLKQELYLSGKPVEKWDAYYEDGSLAGFDLARELPIPDGLYHLACECLVIHRDGDYLLMQRSFKKKLFPGYFEATAGGSALKGEDAFGCVKRELLEETGILSDDFKLIAFNVMPERNTLFYSFLCEVYIDKNNIKFQEGETIGYQWISPDAFVQFSQSEKSIPTQMKRLKDYIKQLNNKKG